MTFFTSSRPLQYPASSRMITTPSHSIHPFQNRRHLRSPTIHPHLTIPLSSSSEGAIPSNTQSIEEKTDKNIYDPSNTDENNITLDPKVAEALEKVKAAMEAAEDGLQRIHLLKSAQLPNIWDTILHSTKPVLQFTSVIAYCYLIHAFNIAASQTLGALLLAMAIAAWGYRKGSLSPSGTVAAMLVGWTILSSSFRAGLVLLAFFFSSSKLTSYKDEDKAVDEDHKSGGYRDWKQVASNGIIPAVLAATAAIMTNRMDLPVRAATHSTLSALYAAFLGYYACCCGDTWASELGQLSPEEPRLITTLRPVRKGTNGGVTLLGLGASVMGGLFVGLVFYLSGIWSPSASGYVHHSAHHAATATATGLTGSLLSSSGGGMTPQWALILLGVFAGLLGSLIDSLLGATIQFTGYNRKTGLLTSKISEDVTPISGIPLLDNNMVNVVSASVTSVVCGLIGGMLF